MSLFSSHKVTFKNKNPKPTGSTRKRPCHVTKQLLTSRIRTARGWQVFFCLAELVSVILTSTSFNRPGNRGLHRLKSCATQIPEGSPQPPTFSSPAPRLPASGHPVNMTRPRRRSFRPSVQAATLRTPKASAPHLQQSLVPARFREQHQILSVFKFKQWRLGTALNPGSGRGFQRALEAGAARSPVSPALPEKTFKPGVGRDLVLWATNGAIARLVGYLALGFSEPNLV